MSPADSKARQCRPGGIGTALHFPWRKVSTAIAEVRAAYVVRISLWPGHRRVPVARLAFCTFMQQL
jgi:hypothetical protein